jgi:hypothetical protein
MIGTGEKWLGTTFLLEELTRREIVGNLGIFEWIISKEILNNSECDCGQGLYSYV